MVIFLELTDSDKRILPVVVGGGVNGLPGEYAIAIASALEEFSRLGFCSGLCSKSISANTFTILSVSSSIAFLATVRIFRHLALWAFTAIMTRVAVCEMDGGMDWPAYTTSRIKKA
jgi:hypothetical protein